MADRDTALAAQSLSEELAARVYSEQGYLVISTNRPYWIGEILYERNNENWRTKLTIPLRVIGVSNESEMEKQTARFLELAGINDKYVHCAFRHFYRVEAAD